MSLFEWKPDYSVNIKEIDNQHKVLISTLNELYDAMRDNETKEAISIILKKLSEYVKVHFSYEESLMKRFNFPDYLEHKKAHDSFTGKIEEFSNKQNKGHIMLSMEIMKFLRDWLKNHILGVDKQYSSFFNEKGIA